MSKNSILKLSSKEKGEIALKLLLEDNKPLIYVQDVFCIGPNTVEKYILEYIQSLENDTEKKEHLELLAKTNMLPSFKAAKALIFSKNSPEVFRKMYSVKRSDYHTALELIKTLTYYKELDYNHIFSVLQKERPPLHYPLGKFGL